MELYKKIIIVIIFILIIVTSYFAYKHYARPSCENHKCKQGQACKLGKCYPETKCNETSECDTGFTCNSDGKCVKVPPTPDLCESIYQFIIDEITQKINMSKHKITHRITDPLLKRLPTKKKFCDIIKFIWKNRKELANEFCSLRYDEVFYTMFGLVYEILDITIDEINSNITHIKTLKVEITDKERKKIIDTILTKEIVTELTNKFIKFIQSEKLFGKNCTYAKCNPECSETQYCHNGGCIDMIKGDMVGGDGWQSKIQDDGFISANIMGGLLEPNNSGIYNQFPHTDNWEMIVNGINWPNELISNPKTIELAKGKCDKSKFCFVSQNKEMEDYFSINSINKKKPGILESLNIWNSFDDKEFQEVSIKIL